MNRRDNHEQVSHCTGFQAKQLLEKRNRPQTGECSWENKSGECLELCYYT